MILSTTSVIIAYSHRSFFTLAGTLAELRDEIGIAKKALTGMKQSVVSISSGCDLFVRFITLTSLDQTVCISSYVIVCVCVCLYVRACVGV